MCDDIGRHTLAATTGRSTRSARGGRGACPRRAISDKRRAPGTGLRCHRLDCMLARAGCRLGGSSTGYRVIERAPLRSLGQMHVCRSSVLDPIAFLRTFAPCSQSQPHPLKGRDQTGIRRHRPHVRGWQLSSHCSIIRVLPTRATRATRPSGAPFELALLF
jgi:hypothetical protein